MQKPRYLLELQRQHRKQPTLAEAVLWRELRGAKLEGARFLRQKAFDRYIVDFYCAAAQLVIELDGSVHNTPEAVVYDLERTRTLETRGLQVLRFRNEVVMHQLPQVLEIIRNTIRARQQ